jgi:hypothetical protein
VNAPNASTRRIKIHAPSRRMGNIFFREQFLPNILWREGGHIPLSSGKGQNIAEKTLLRVGALR